MQVFPSTLAGIARYSRAFQGKADVVPMLAQINEHGVKVYGGDVSI